MAKWIARWLAIALAGGGLAVAASSLGLWPSAAESAKVVPSPVADAPAPQTASEVIVLAGGCFWACKACSSTSRASPVRCRVTPAARRARRSTTRSRCNAPAMPSTLPKKTLVFWEKPPP